VVLGIPELLTPTTTEHVLLLSGRKEALSKATPRGSLSGWVISRGALTVASRSLICAARLVLDDKARARGSPYEASLDGRLTTREPPCRARLTRFGSFMNLARYLRTGFLCIELHFALTRALLSFILDTDVTFKH